MSGDLEFEMEPQLTAEEFAFELDPEAAATAVTEAFSAAMHQASAPVDPAAEIAPAPAALMQVLPADFPLPTLIRFVPDPALRQAADEAARYALSLEVREAEGCQRADAALTALRTSLKAIDAHFEEPADIANRLHKQITGTRAEWTAAGKAALLTVGTRVATELRRLQAEAQERTRRAQEEENRKARERARQDAEAAAKAAVPAPVVEQMRQQAETVTAPPVAVDAPAPKLVGSSAVGTWKARLKGCSGEADPLPSTDALTPPQREQVLTLLRAIVAGTAPVQSIELNASYLGKRAKADRSTLDIPGIEAFEDLGLRGKASRK